MFVGKTWETRRELSGTLSYLHLDYWLCFGRKIQSAEIIGHVRQDGTWRGSRSRSRFPRGLNLPPLSLISCPRPTWGPIVWVGRCNVSRVPTPESAQSICSVQVHVLPKFWNGTSWGLPWVWPIFRAVPGNTSPRRWNSGDQHPERCHEAAGVLQLLSPMCSLLAE